jgi:hypothetical protein
MRRHRTGFPVVRLLVLIAALVWVVPGVFLVWNLGGLALDLVAPDLSQPMRANWAGVLVVWRSIATFATWLVAAALLVGCLVLPWVAWEFLMEEWEVREKRRAGRENAIAVADQALAELAKYGTDKSPDNGWCEWHQRYNCEHVVQRWQGGPMQ